MRILHFSDVHLLGPLRATPLRAWLGKRLVGGLNLLLRRARHFAEAWQKLEALGRFRREEAIDVVICTGDYTMLGTDGEFAAARRALLPLLEAPLGYLHVPGNHDLYARDAVRQTRFERHFHDTLATDLPEYRVQPSPWPLVRMLGEQAAVVAINSARPNPQPWRSSGRIPAAELAALERLLRDRRLDGRLVFLVTHHAPRLADGGPDRRLHGLRNADDLLRACAGITRGVILCGHVHERYSVRIPEVPAPIFCAGSATHAGREGLWVFDLQSHLVRATPGRWTGDRYALQPDGALRF
jgi:3',5'-cyclic AMP phosphodiesterase CpdA